MEIEGRAVAITGVGGFIGRRVAALARARGARVRGIDLDAAAAARAVEDGVDARPGDVTDPASAAWLTRGADVVVHAAAVVKEAGPMPLFEAVNVGGTRTVAAAAREAGVARFVHLSSVMVYGFDFPDGVEEEGPYPCTETNPYVVTKLRSEGTAMAFHGEMGVTILRPGDVYGRGSGPWVDRPLGLMRQGLMILPDGGRGVLNLVHVDDLARAILDAVARDVTGLPINVCDGARTTCADYFGALAEAAGLPRPRAAPLSLLRPLFASIEAAADAVGREPPARVDALRYLLRPGVYSNARARSLLGWAPSVAWADGIRDCV